jgi:hypothetical protein
MGDRPAVEGDPQDPVAAGALVAAHWLAAQIMESRWQWAKGEGMLGALSWERPENGYPFQGAAGPVPEWAVERGRAIVAAANAPVTAWLSRTEGGLEARVVNDEAETELTFRLVTSDGVAWQETRIVSAQAGLALPVPPLALTKQEGSVVRLEVHRGDKQVAEAAAVVLKGL